jgi:hypothetical protein
MNEHSIVLVHRTDHGNARWTMPLSLAGAIFGHRDLWTVGDTARHPDSGAVWTVERIVVAAGAPEAPEPAPDALVAHLRRQGLTLLQAWVSAARYYSRGGRPA